MRPHFTNTRRRDGITRPRIFITRRRYTKTIAKARITSPCDSSFGYSDLKTIGLIIIMRPRIKGTRYRVLITRGLITITRPCDRVTRGRCREWGVHIGTSRPGEAIEKTATCLGAWSPCNLKTLRHSYAALAQDASLDPVDVGYIDFAIASFIHHGDGFHCFEQRL